MWRAPDFSLLSPETVTGRLEFLLGRYMALPGLILLSFGAFYDVNPGNVGLALLLVATFLAVPLCWHSLKREPLFWLTVGFSAWVLFAAWLGASARPDWGYEIWSTSGDWFLTPFLGTLVTAFWLARFPRLFGWLLAFLVVGYVMRVFTHTSPEMLGTMLEGTKRATFGDSANNFGLWSLICAIVLLGFIPVQFRARSLWTRVTTWTIWLSAFVIAISGLVLSQTRGAWLAAPFAFAVMAYRFLVERYPELSRRKITGVSLVSICIVIGLITIAFSDIIAQRTSHHAGTIMNLVSGQLDDLPGDSVGYRIRLYSEGFTTWYENPIAGSGPAIPAIALAESDDAGIHRFNDFHNLYLDVLASFGLTGLLMLGLLLALAVSSSRTAIRSGWISCSTGNTLLASAVAFAISQLFSSSLHSYRGPFVVALLIGMACAWRFVPLRDRRRADGTMDT